MTDGVADTSIFIANKSGRALRTDALPERLAVSVITIGELRAGVLAATDVDTRARRLATLTRALTLDPIVVDDRVAEAWARLSVTLRELGLRMPINDSWIAATALSLGVPVVTQDEDYVEVPGLAVIRVRSSAACGPDSSPRYQGACLRPGQVLRQGADADTAR